MKPARLALLAALTLWPATPKLPAELQLAYLEASMDVADAITAEANARAVRLAAQERLVAALAKANAWCPVTLVGHRLECVAVAPAAMRMPAQLPASSMSGGAKR